MFLFKKSNKFAFTVLLCLGLSLVMASWCSRSLAADVAVIRIKYHWASEVLPIVQSMLSPKGTVTASKRINSLIIVDSPDSIQRVRNYLDGFDKPLEQVRIHVRFYEPRADAAGAVAARGKVSGDNISVATGGKKKDGVDLSLKSRDRSQTNFSEFFVFATSGQPAFIRAGQEIPYKGRWPDYIRRYSTGGSAVMFQSVETGFEVTPTIAGDLVHLKIVPRAAYGEGNAAIIRFYGARTELTTSYGQWVEIGGTNSQSNEVIKEILSQGNQRNRSPVSMLLMVEKP
jgi:type II secretory pathway component GspD/PulD (secretin)